jgi:hypothetical protein
MALIVEYHVVADMYPTTAGISAGMIVTLNSAGAAVPAPTATSIGKSAVGIAGDSSLTSAGQTTAYSAQVTIGADGAATRWTENRVSDFYDETVASQKITIYNGGGKFWVSEDLFDAAASVTPGTTLGISGSTAGEWEEAATVTDDDICGIAVGSNTAYDSGVPGTDTTDGSITLGNYVPLILRL